MHLIDTWIYFLVINTILSNLSLEVLNLGKTLFQNKSDRSHLWKISMVSGKWQLQILYTQIAPHEHHKRCSLGLGVHSGKYLAIFHLIFMEKIGKSFTLGLLCYISVLHTMHGSATAFPHSARHMHNDTTIFGEYR